MPRQSKKFKATFESGVKGIVALNAKLMQDAGIENAEALAPSIFAAMAGAVSIARTISDPSLSDEFLATTRTGIRARLGLSDAALASETTN